MKTKLINRNTDYAIRALGFLAQKGEMATVQELVEKLKIPRPFLRNILQILNKKGVVKSYKGTNGGFVLTGRPEKIFLLDLIEAFQGTFGMNECLFKKRLCPDTKTCLLRKEIDNIEKMVFLKLKSITLASLLNKNNGEILQEESMLVKQKLMEELREYFGSDNKRIEHAEKVLRFAEKLLKKEKTADSHIVIPASILHDVGIKIAEQKYGSSAGHYQEKEGPAIARKILLKLGFKNANIDQICEIIAHHHSPGKIDTLNFKILYDADHLVNLEDKVKMENKAKLTKIIEKTFLTNTGKELAKKRINTHL